jgi:hypothetical protein
MERELNDVKKYPIGAMSQQISILEGKKLSIKYKKRGGYRLPTL